MTTTKGQEVISNRWKRSGIYDSITLGSSKLPAVDPFRKRVRDMTKTYNQSYMSTYESCSTHGNTEPHFLVSTRAQFVLMEGR